MTEEMCCHDKHTVSPLSYRGGGDSELMRLLVLDTINADVWPTLFCSVAKVGGVADIMSYVLSPLQN